MTATDPRPRPPLAIVMPALNERAAIERSLPAALAVADEVILCDGGSNDGTAELARQLGARVVTSPPGRGLQLNRGAAAASAPILLFLHADTTLPAGAADAVRAAIAAGAPGGAFLIAFDSGLRRMRFGAWLINLRTRITRTPLGDQAQFATRATFDALSGFRSWPILEDLDFAWRMRRRGRIAILPGPVTTGARRFLQRGVVRTVATNWLIWALFLCGVSPERLARLYREIR